LRSGPIAHLPNDYGGPGRLANDTTVHLAKHGYVVSRCGSFSDRSFCHLASGRPVIAQDTGFSEWLPTGDGVLAFGTAEEAAAAIEAVRGDHASHGRAARALAEDVFDSDRVLTELLACL
jgi:hypothetical protein